VVRFEGYWDFIGSSGIGGVHLTAGRQRMFLDNGSNRSCWVTTSIGPLIVIVYPAGAGTFDIIYIDGFFDFALGARNDTEERMQRSGPSEKSIRWRRRASCRVSFLKKKKEKKKHKIKKISFLKLFSLYDIKWPICVSETRW
jgi:hypothetical protein